jgi:pentatricopeptide repeat protein
MVVDQDAHVEGESLPFWLNDAAEVEVTPGEGYVQAADAAAHAGGPLVMGQVTAADEIEDDFADLPPVQPFDFTQMEGEVKEESLGFNTEELIGMSQGEHDPMVVTANLEALADLVGGPLPAGIDPRQAKGTAAAAEPADVALSEPELVIPEEEDDTSTSEAQRFGTDMEDAGWMSTVTTDLAASGLVEPTAALPAMPAGPADSTGLSGELGVSPFDINSLDVEEESSTSVLDRIATVGPDTDKLEARQVSGAHVTSPRMDEEYEGDDAETATSIFAQPMSDLDAGTGEGETPTSRLATVETPEAQPAPEQPAVGVFKARVAGGRWTSTVPQVTAAEAPRDEALHSPWDGGRTGMRAEEPAQVEEQEPQPAPATAQEQQREHEPAFEMPKPGDTTVSGPLPALTGYEDLVELMEKNPQDTGSYMAMATAYVNSGELESALRVYRRMIKRPGVSATLLNMVDEELEELRDAASNLPRYHQVRGDLYLKLGRHREAIDEYNKLV